MSGSVNALISERLALKAIRGLPREDVVYAVFTDFVYRHKTPLRFTVYPQMHLKWKLDEETDRRCEVPDLGLGNFTLPGVTPRFKLRVGVEAKRGIAVMATLPRPESIITHPAVELAFREVYFQAEDQTKAAYKNGYPLSDQGPEQHEMWKCFPCCLAQRVVGRIFPQPWP